MIFIKEITIKFIYQGYSTKIMRGGSFPVNIRRFKDNPEREAARIAFEWMKEIRKEGHIEEILKVTYDEDHDITDLVIALEKAPINK
jgi:hypothetical protein